MRWLRLMSTHSDLIFPIQRNWKASPQRLALLRDGSNLRYWGILSWTVYLDIRERALLQSSHATLNRTPSDLTICIVGNIIIPKLATISVKIHMAITMLGPSSTQKWAWSVSLLSISHSSSYEAGANANHTAVPIVYVTNNRHTHAIDQ